MAQPGYIYLIGSTRFGWYKIGRSRKPDIRIKDLGILLPFKVEAFAVWKTTNAELTEKLFHKKHSAQNINGEWFSFGTAQVAGIIHGDAPYDALRVYPGQARVFCGFQNVVKDRVVNHKSRSEVAHRKENGRAFSDAMNDYLREHNLEQTPKNRTLAREAIKSAYQHLEFVAH